MMSNRNPPLARHFKLQGGACWLGQPKLPETIGSIGTIWVLARVWTSPNWTLNSFPETGIFYQHHVAGSQLQQLRISTVPVTVAPVKVAPARVFGNCHCYSIVTVTPARVPPGARTSRSFFSNTWKWRHQEMLLGDCRDAQDFLGLHPQRCFSLEFWLSIFMSINPRGASGCISLCRQTD